MQIEALRANKYNNAQKGRDDKLNKTLKGVLINNHVDNSLSETNISFDEIQDSLLVVDKNEYYTPPENKQDKEESSFNIKKAIKPLLIGTTVLIGGVFALSSILKSSSKTLLNSKSFECLPDLAINNNIKQEPQFAIYRAIRDPNAKNIFGAIAVFAMSAITIACKNFIDGIKEIWEKKKSADIEKELQENLIQVETNSFSGKLKIVNDMMNKNVQYFDKVLNNKQKVKDRAVFNDFISFKGTGSKKNNNETGETNQNDELKKNLKYILLSAGIIAGAIILGKMTISNIKQTAGNTNSLANKIAENVVNEINKKANAPQEKDIPSVIEYLKSICAKPEFVKEIGEKYGLSEDKISSIIKEVEKEKSTIFADAPTALGGIPKKLQYYCYIDENRGHLYNWILHPENKFTKYIFLSFTLSSAIGYMFKQAMDAIKNVTVMRENAKTELGLRQRLVDVEVRNFQAKKESAIKPLVDNFSSQVQSGQKSREELKQLADNILTEIKNGPPYVYT
ncbi:MAG: hypothetical protein ACI37R_07520 [Candidatus Avigastranaerophilus sp.]